MPEHELWLTALFNKFLAAPANAVLDAVRMPAPDPAKPWANWMTMELLAVLVIVALVLAVRGALSVDKPGTLQHLFELVYGFIRNTAEEVGIHHPEKYVAFFATVFLFILTMNLIGCIPGFEAATMFAWVPCGLAIVSFLYYNFKGLGENGFSYLKHFLGPIWWLAWLMLPIEIVSHFARPMSLTIRLYANMFAGEQVTMAFQTLTYFVIPAIFMGLHVFVAFLQAYIFTLLSMIYVSGAVAHDH
jgi:F-type H+-transporting ATPase subunit a